MSRQLGYWHAGGRQTSWQQPSNSKTASDHRWSKVEPDAEAGWWSRQEQELPKRRWRARGDTGLTHAGKTWGSEADVTTETQQQQQQQPQQQRWQRPSQQMYSLDEADVAGKATIRKSWAEKKVADMEDVDDDDMAAPPRSRPRQFPRRRPRVDDGALALPLRSVCVVGGGPAGLACCRALCSAGLEVTLVQESRGLGGKLCTKFANGKEDPTLHFDMGVQLLRPEGPFHEALDPSIVQPWPGPGRFKKIFCSGDWRSWKIDEIVDLPTEGYVVGVPSMSSIGRHLASQCDGLTIHLDRSGHVRGQDPTTSRWEVEWRREAATAGQIRYRPELANMPTEVGRGDFDAVVLAFEANKILRGCKSGYKMVQASATESVRKQVAGKAKTSQVWNLMVAFEKELPMPWDAATLEGHPAIAWLAVDSSKPQRSKVPQCFMVLTTRKWADWKQWGKKEVERELLEELIQFLHKILGYRPPQPCFVLSGRWGNNTETVLTGVRPTGEFPMKALGFYDKELPVVWDAENRMAATGDWVSGYSVSDAYNAGLSAADPLLDKLRKADGLVGA